MADPNKKDDMPAMAMDAAPAPQGPNMKIIMGLLGLNVVVMIGVVLVLFMGQKKRDKELTLDQIAAGAGQGEHGGAPAAGDAAKAAGGHGAPAATESHDEEHAARFFNVGEFTANLSGPASASYIKVNVNFELDPKVDEEELKKRKAQMRDRVIAILNSKKPTELQTSEGRNNLKEEIKTAINGVLRTGTVTGVYYSTFIVN